MERLVSELFPPPALPRAGDIARYQGDRQAAIKAFSAARPLLETILRKESRDFDGLPDLAALDALLGQKEIALEKGRRLLSQATPGETQEVPASLYHWARVLTFAGEREEAICTLGTICGRPFRSLLRRFALKSGLRPFAG